ncbi:probable basic-leucine zipper transcription factor R isoform X2 [Drosophila busckii]|uniref:probable basic-leucine zipper transcription factor R isoform X2 n=1 Tax=Drosophila busckii TaxID=30019 RepID=UPI00083F18F0|nr:probable basic-leucine zipper transcription factor R isoform X2 [Drosophila busckii]
MDGLCESVVNIPKELILISLVSQEQALYNPKHQHYRSTKSKDEKWCEIGSHVGWTDTQCKAKWKAMRDQYCRELKRAKANTKNNVKWKYFKELDFLRPYALARNYRSRGSQGSNGAVQLTNAASNNASSSSNNHNNTSFSNSSNSSQNLNLSADPSKFSNIKIEESSGSLLDNCTFVPTTTTSTIATVNALNVEKKTDTTRGLLNAFMGSGQLIEQQQQQQQPQTNWNYLTDANSSAVNNTAITVTCEMPNTTTGDTLYNDFVDCVNAASAVSQSNAQSHGNHADEEDDDPIHTFLNMESYFEKELISLIQQEDMIYNYSNQNYRNVKLKLAVWDEIARKLKKPVKQCRQKWKALRDQYAREYKRLKTQLHIDATSRWKHYDSLSFLQKYIQQKTLDGDALNMLLPKHDAGCELDEHMTQSHAEPQANSLSTSPNSLPSLPPLSAPHKAELASLPDQQQQQQQQTPQASELCVASYDEMDIENYINGDAAQDDDTEEDEDEDMQDTSTTEQPTQHQQQPQHAVSFQTAEEPVYSAVPTLAKVEAPTNSSSNLEPPQQQQQHQQLQASTDFIQKLEVHTPTSTGARYHSVNSAATATPSTSNHALFTQNASSMAEEDEIDFFFNSVAMKIRNAQLEPVAFTDLQIHILRVINEALRNH